MHGYELWKQQQAELETEAARLLDIIQQLEGEQPDDLLMPLVVRLARLVQALVRDRPSWKVVG